MTEITQLGVKAIRDGVAEGAFTAREAAEAFNANVAAASQLSAFIVATPEKALGGRRQGRCRPRGEQAAGRRWPGVPVGMKDLFATRGVQTTAASHILEGSSPSTRAPSARGCGTPGAGMLGKLNLDQFAMGSSNETSYFGDVISPWRRGGGGNAALAPERLVGRELGGGCGAAVPRRRPGPTPAARSASPPRSPASRRSSRLMAAAAAGALSPSPRSLDQAGPMARSVEDCAIMLEAMAGFDRRIRPASTCRCRVGRLGSTRTSAARRSAFRASTGWTGPTPKSSSRGMTG